MLGGQPKDFIPLRLQKLANLHGPLFLVLNLQHYYSPRLYGEGRLGLRYSFVADA